jgi:hypothetical protein
MEPPNEAKTAQGYDLTWVYTRQSVLTSGYECGGTLCRDEALAASDGANG